MTRYTNFGSFVQRNEFFNELRKVEIDDAHTANALVSTQLSLHPPSPPPPPGATAAGSPTALDAGGPCEAGQVAHLGAV
jgi:hypothetical protein